MTITRGGGEEVVVNISTLNPPEITRDSLDGFVESDGHVSIEAEHFSRSVPAGTTRWEKIDDYGRTLSGMAILPVTAATAAAPGSACLEYKMYLFAPGNVSIAAVVGPSLNFVAGRGLRYAVSFDDEPPQVMTIVPADFNAQNGNRNWEASVRDSARVIRSSHALANPGYHTLKFWMIDPGVVLQKLVVDCGGIRPSYLGPPESYRNTP